MSVAYQYNNCYWNASGEFECMGNNQRVTKKVLENSIKTYPPAIPCENRQFVQPSHNYASVPISRKDLNRGVIEAYESPKKTQLRRDERNDELCPLSREMEISVYMPDRDKQFPWDRKDQQHQKEMRLQELREVPQIPEMKIVPEVHKFPKKEKNDIPLKIFAPSKSAIVKPIMASFGSDDIQWNQKIKNMPYLKKRPNKYYFQIPYNKYYELVDEFGPPTLINPNKGGIAVWQHSSLKNTKYHMIKRIDLVDEQVYNCFPYPHIGFLYTYIKMNIPMNKLGHVLSMCGDIMYDSTKHILIVRGMSLSYNLAIMALICQYITSKITWYNITENNMIKQCTSHNKLTNIKAQKRNIAILNATLTGK